MMDCFLSKLRGWFLVVYNTTAHQLMITELTANDYGAGIFRHMDKMRPFSLKCGVMYSISESDFTKATPHTRW